MIKKESEKVYYENQLKELKKRNYLVSIELEKRGNLLEKLIEDNKTLKTKNDEFLTNTLSLIKSRENDIENFLTETDEKNINTNTTSEKSKSIKY